MGKHNNHQGGRPRREVKQFQAAVGLSEIIPKLKASGAIPRALENIIEEAKRESPENGIMPRYDREMRLKCSFYIIDKFLPALTDLNLQEEEKKDYGDAIFGLLKMLDSRISGGIKAKIDGTEPPAVSDIGEGSVPQAH